MSVKEVSNNAEVDERMAALTTNANAIRAVASAVEGTIGPKGLDTMLIDQFGSVVITNDGVTILNLMEVNHPAARMLINIAKAQQEEIGDGTTTATILAGSLVNAGMEKVIKGVPVAKVIEGLQVGVQKALTFFKEHSVQIKDVNEPILKKIALIAGRGHEDIADLTVKAGRFIGKEKLKEANIKLADTVVAKVGAENQVFEGVVINKQRMNPQMPIKVEDAKVLIVDDALEPEEIEAESLSTEAGFHRFSELQQEFCLNLEKLKQLGVKLVLVDRGISPLAEEMLTDAGILAIQRVAHKELRRAMEHCGARFIKRTGLKKDVADLKKYLGKAALVYEDEKLEQTFICDGMGKPMATVLVGAATEEVVGERERIAKDAASSIQAAVKGGYVPGGGAIELAAAKFVEENRQEAKGMASYGLDCVVEALQKPFLQIVLNSGFNPLEKIGDVLASQKEQDSIAYALDCDTGDIIDMLEKNVVDSALVKIYALKAAGEVAEAILRINTIIKMKEYKSSIEDSDY
jgi:chaperonin GroEL (HSP60 family)